MEVKIEERMWRLRLRRERRDSPVHCQYIEARERYM
jgi:hypothetical protein